jgi:hypothetical protein
MMWASHANRAMPSTFSIAAPPFYKQPGRIARSDGPPVSVLQNFLETSWHVPSEQTGKSRCHGKGDDPGSQDHDQASLPGL